jgi:hypothetical protein
MAFIEENSLRFSSSECNSVSISVFIMKVYVRFIFFLNDQNTEIEFVLTIFCNAFDLYHQIALDSLKFLRYQQLKNNKAVID